MHNSCATRVPFGSISNRPRCDKPREQVSSRLACSGLRVPWHAPFITYPVAAHDGTVKGLRYNLKAINTDPDEVIISSKRCCGWASEDGGPCLPCKGAKAYIDVVQDEVQRGVGVAPYAIMLQKLEETENELKELKLKHLNMGRSLEAAHRKIEAYREVVGYIADHDSIPAVQRLCRTARNNGDGPEGILKRLKASREGTYRARNYSDDDYDLSALLHLLGGKSAVHAAHHSHVSLPALKTTSGLRRNLALKICAGIVRVADIAQNVATHFRPREPSSPRPRRIGFTLGLDEIVGKGTVVYLPRTDEIAGFCREHVGHLATIKVGLDLTSTTRAVQAVWAEKVHIGKEFTVAAILPHSMTRYYARPILLSATCKHGTVTDSYKLLSACIRAWRESEWGEQWSGPLWAISSDGDATRRAAMYALCMCHGLRENTSLYRHLRGAVPIASFANSIYSGLCTLFCSKEGLLVQDVAINKALLSTWLQRLTDHDWSEANIHALLNPKDPQNVPRAIHLLTCITELRYIDPADLDPSERRIHRALAIVGEAVDGLLQPFLNIHFSLSEQLQSLVKSAHIFCALWRENTTHFVSNQLYGDIQCLVKHAAFHIAQSQDLDGDLKVSLNIFGTDILEALFGYLRMLGGHSPTMDIAELELRCRSALTLAEIFHRHPDWERQPDRLKFTRSRDFDHIRPRNWEGDVIAKNCNIQQSWMAGAAEATYVLRRHGIIIDFFALFSSADIDLMRPHGGQHYPGVAKDIDRSMLQEAVDADGEVADVAPPAASCATDDAEGCVPLDADLHGNEGEAGEISADDAEASHSPWMKIGNVLQHKATVAREAFSRLVNEHNLPRSERFELGDLFATLVRIRGEQVALAIALCTAIKPTSGSASVAAVPRADMLIPSTTYYLSGQVLALKGIASNANETQWYWKSDFIAFEPVRTRQSTTPRLASAPRSRGELVFTVPAHLSIPLVDEASRIDTADVPNEVEIHTDGEITTTWVIGEPSMVSLRSRLWDRVVEDSAQSLSASIPTYGKVLQGAFPYAVEGGEFSPSITHTAGVIAAPPPKGKERIDCRVCGQSVATKDSQNHTGRHILRALLDTSAPFNKLFLQISFPYPCGFCGGPSSQGGENGSCSTQRGKGQVAVSSCSRAYSFRISSASSFKEDKPSSTNVPIICVLCNAVHWKYNMQQHLKERHPSWESTVPLDSPFRTSISIGENEKQWALAEGQRTSSKRRNASPPPLDSGRRSSKRRELENQAPLPVQPLRFVLFEPPA
ncbi:hypothetical protein GGF50DRAFT_63940 [Schizophyllum commune]